MTTHQEPRPALTFKTDVAALTPPEAFLSAIADFGLELEPLEVERYGRFLAMLLAANEQMNLTAITTPEEMWMRHIFDSLTLLPMLAELPEKARVADVGSGAGLPGIPLAIALPKASFSLIESTGKKAAFIEAAVRALGLRNVKVLNARAEEVGRDWNRGQGTRESFDAAVARAVGRLSIIAELCVPLVRVGGLVLLHKGAKADEELAEAAGALEKLKTAHAGTVETPTGRIVALEKLVPTPRLYPRAPGEPAKNPLR